MSKAAKLLEHVNYDSISRYLDHEFLTSEGWTFYHEGIVFIYTHPECRVGIRYTPNTERAYQVFIEEDKKVIEISTEVNARFSHDKVVRTVNEYEGLRIRKPR